MSMQHNVQAQPTPIDDLSNIFAPIDVHACVNLPFWTSKFRWIASARRCNVQLTTYPSLCHSTACRCWSANMFAPIAVWIHSCWCGPRVSQLAIYVLHVAPAVIVRRNAPWVACSSTDRIVVSTRCGVPADFVHHMGIEEIFPHGSTISRTLRLHLTEHDVSYFEMRITVAPFRISPLVDWLESAMVPGRHTRICQRSPCALVHHVMPHVQTNFD